MRLLTPLKQMSHHSKVRGSQINFSRNNIEAFMSLLQMSVDLVCEGFDCVVWGCRVCFHCSQLPHAWCTPLLQADVIYSQILVTSIKII